MYKTTWADVDMGALRRNIYLLKSKVAPGALICGVVKADGYGHGAVQIAREMEREGIHFFATANLREAVELRNEGIQGQILVLGWTPPEGFQSAVMNQIALTIFSAQDLPDLEKAAVDLGKNARVHLKMESGMNRLGASWEGEIVELARQICSYDHIDMEGTFSHFSSSDIKDTPWVEEQLRRYLYGLELLKGAGIEPGIRHMANSGGILFYPESHLDMVRMGCASYGIGFDRSEGLEPVLTLKTRVGMIKELSSGDTISYGRDFVVEEPLRIATVPIGYADGWTWSLREFVWQYPGQKIRIVGNICMDQMMLDITEFPFIQVGDEIVLMGKGETRTEDIARYAGVSELEIMVRLSKRVPRIYID